MEMYPELTVMRKTEAEPFQLNKEQLPIDLLGKASRGVIAEYILYL